jgi:hypothetical protein
MLLINPFTIRFSQQLREFFSYIFLHKGANINPFISITTSFGQNSSINFFNSITCLSKTFSLSVFPNTNKFTKFTFHGVSLLGKTLRIVATV